MTSHLHHRVALAGLLAVASGLACAAKPAYHLTDLGPGSSAAAINTSGVIAGALATDGNNPSVAAIYKNGAWTTLAQPGWPFGALTSQINASGAVAGYVTAYYESTYAAMWTKKGKLVELSPPGATFTSRPVGIASDGTIALNVGDQDQAGYCYTWRDDVFTMFYPPIGYATATLGAINDHDQIAATAVDTGGNKQLALYAAGQWTLLGTIGGNGIYPSAINDSGHIAGTAINAQGHDHMFLYDGATLSDLGALSGGDAQATAMNAHDTIVGQSTDKSQTGWFPVVWTAGRMYRLASLIDNLPAGYEIEEPRGINDAGVIVGSMWSPSGGTHGYMLTPVTP